MLLALALSTITIETAMILKMIRCYLSSEEEEEEEEEENHPHDDGVVSSSSSFSAEGGGVCVSEKITIVQRSND